MEIPYGYCQCGCGQKTRIATRTSPADGIVKGQPNRYVFGHGNRVRDYLPNPNPSGLCMCGCGQPAPIAAQTSKALGHVQGFPKRYVMGHGKRKQTDEERFWTKVDKRGPDECWGWIGGTDRKGYGSFGVSNMIDGKKRHVIASRFSWEIHHGPIPDALFVLHKCDNPPCVNPKHLFLGDAQANIDDMIAKGRAHFQKTKQG